MIEVIGVRAVHLVRRPDGLPYEDEFAFVDFLLSPLGEGQIFVENVFFSVDPLEDVPEAC